MKFSFMPYDAMILSGNYECSMWHFGKTVMHKLIMNRNWNDNKKKKLNWWYETQQHTAAIRSNNQM